MRTLNEEDPRVKEVGGKAYIDSDGVLRNGRDQPLIMPPGGGKRKPYLRPSGAGSTAFDASGLSRWQTARVAEGVVKMLAPKPEGDRKDLIARIRKLSKKKTPPTSSELGEIAATLLDMGGGNDASEGGTVIHRGLEDHFKGREGDSYEHSAYGSLLFEVLGTIDALENAGLQVVENEIFLANHELGYAGTADLVLRFVEPEKCDAWHKMPEDVQAGEALVVGDLKTWAKKTRDKVTKAAMQMAIYATSDRYDVKTEESTPLGATASTGLVVHTPIGGTTTEIIPIDLDKALNLVHLGRTLRTEAAKNHAK